MRIPCDGPEGGRPLPRHYIAFISYRHLPLDMEVAAKVHRTIEHYVIPKALRKDGRKQLGYVFRDKEELPVSRELTENIREALDNSEYLIVICTPDTGKSAWVQREIELFLEAHDRDKVILVLAAGTPEESFPEPLTQVRNADGEIVRHYEPLAANIVASNRLERSRLFRTEILRVLAVLVGCSFDDLYRRDKRYRRQRLIFALAAGCFILAVFIGMLLNRNAVISRQLTETLINESKTLTALSLEKFRRGNVSEAVQDVLQALPSEENRKPYVPEAEDALSQELSLYRDEAFCMERSIHGKSAFSDFCLTSGGKYLVTLESADAMVQAYDNDTGGCLWTTRLPNKLSAWESLQILQSDDILVCGYGQCARISGKDGAILWVRTDGSADAVSEDRKLFLSCMEEGPAEGYTVRIADTETGETVRSFQAVFEKGSLSFPICGAVSPNGNLAVMLWMADEFHLRADLFDLKNGAARTITKGGILGDLSAYYEIAFTDAEDIVIAAKGKLESDICFFDRENDFREPRIIHSDVTRDADSTLRESLFCADAQHLLFAGQNKLQAYNGKSGEILWEVELKADLLEILVYNDGRICLVRNDGSILLLSEPAEITQAPDLEDSFSCEVELDRAVGVGSSYDRSSFAVLPKYSRKGIALIRPKNRQDWERIAAAGEDYPAAARALFSASCEKMILAACDHDHEGLSGTAFDFQTGDSFNFQIPIDIASWQPECCALTEDFTLMLGEDRCFLLRDAVEGTLHRNASDKNAALEIPTGTELEAEMQDRSVSGFLPVGDGKTILSFSGEVLRVFDLHTGKKLSETEFSEFGLTFSPQARLQSIVLPDRHQLLIVADDPGYAESAAILLETDTWQRAAFYLSVIGYDAIHDRVVLQHRDGLYTAPLYTLSEKRDLGLKRT